MKELKSLNMTFQQDRSSVVLNPEFITLLFSQTILAEVGQFPE